MTDTDRLVRIWFVAVGGVIAGVIGILLLAVGWPPPWTWDASSGWQGGVSVWVGMVAGWAIHAWRSRA